MEDPQITQAIAETIDFFPQPDVKTLFLKGQLI